MKKKGKLLFGFTLLGIMIISLFCYWNKTSKSISYILKTDSYNYLPYEAKNYIEKIYEKTGNIVLTEKNKQENTPYLNPLFIDYLTLSEEEKEKLEIIPDVYVIDFTGVSEEIDGTDLPAQFSLENINGDSYISIIKNQANLDLCWDFTTLEQAESYLYLKNNTPYEDGVSTIFSTRQLDYATSYNGITNYTNLEGVRNLTAAGNFNVAANALANGLGLVDENYMPFNEDTTTKSLATVLNYSNSLYEVETTVSFPAAPTAGTTDFTNYINLVKSYLMENGGAYVGTQAPGYSCSATNIDSYPIIRVDSGCTANANHAMQIIGWDDNYQYSYCRSGSAHSQASGCSGTVVNGTGAWILRNSWGSIYTYAYLAYDSLSSNISLSTSIVSMEDREWDNNYHKVRDAFYSYYNTSYSEHFSKNINTVEKIEKVKFYGYNSTSATFYLTIRSDSHNYVNVASMSTSIPGIQMFDLSSLNIIINDPGFSIEVYSSSTNGYLFEDSISVFTSNVNSNPIIETDDIVDVSNGNHELLVHSLTKNIPSGTVVNYSLWDIYGVTDYSSYLTVTDNVVAINEILANVTVSSSFPDQGAVLKISYNEYSSTSKLLFTEPLSGSGTVADPYLITNEEDLRAMAYDLDAHYLLSNDITLEEEWVPIGTLEHPFSGSLNGGGNKIINLFISQSDYDNAGLFGYVLASSSTFFSNIIFDAPQIHNSGNTGTLAGTITGVTSLNSTPSSNIYINDIFVIGGEVASYSDNVGTIVGTITSPINDYKGIHRYYFNRVFSSCVFFGQKSAGMIGSIIGSPTSANRVYVNMINVENLGNLKMESIYNTRTVISTRNHGFVIGYIYPYSSVSLTNVITTSYYYDYVPYFSHSFIGSRVSNDVSYSCTNCFSLSSSSVSITDFISDANYSSWPDFVDNWVYETIDGVMRIPLVKGTPFEYTSFPESITVNYGEDVLLSSFISPDIDAAHRVIYTANSDDEVLVPTEVLNDEEKVVDVSLHGESIGTSTIHVVSNYDGGERDIVVNVVNGNETTITYFANNGTEDYDVETVSNLVDIVIGSSSFEKVGYVFDSWNTKADGTGTKYDPEDSFSYSLTSLDLYAQWTPITYKVRFNSNGGEGEMSDQTFTYDEAANLSENTFTYEKYVFVEWNTEEDGTGLEYADKENVVNLSSTNNDVINLYAQWERFIDISSSEYTIDKENSYIDRVPIGVGVDDFVDGLELGEGVTVEVELSNQEFVHTGSITKVYVDNELLKTFTNIVRGDCNGDGKVNSGDLLRMIRHLNNSLPFTEVYFMAADANVDNKVNSGDLLRLIQHMNGSKPL